MDTTAQLVEHSPAKGSVQLNDKAIGYAAQQRSLENQLKNVQSKKEAWLKTQALKDKNLGQNKDTKKDQEGQGSPGQVDRGREQVFGVDRSKCRGLGLSALGSFDKTLSTQL